VRSGRQKHAAAAVSPKRYGLGTLGVWQIVRCGHNQPNDPSPSFRHDSRTRPRLPSRRGRAGGAAEPDASRPAVAIPVLASLVCASPFDIAIHDAYGELHGIDTFQTYGPEHLAFDLAALLEPAASTRSLTTIAPGANPTTAIPSRSSTGLTATASGA
jgi:hypothetical protein